MLIVHVSEDISKRIFRFHLPNAWQRFGINRVACILCTKTRWLQLKVEVSLTFSRREQEEPISSHNGIVHTTSLSHLFAVLCTCTSTGVWKSAPMVQSPRVIHEEWHMQSGMRHSVRHWHQIIWEKFPTFVRKNGSLYLRLNHVFFRRFDLRIPLLCCGRKQVSILHSTTTHNQTKHHQNQQHVM